MRTGSRILIAFAVSVLTFAGCATQRGIGAAPQFEKGKDVEQGEAFFTESLPQGVASALFPDPGWR